MSSEPEYSESGDPIFRYEHREREWEFAAGNEETIEAVTAHIDRHVGRPASVFHELMSDLVHVDVHIVAPTPQRDFITLVTSGMSDRPMNAPEGMEDARYAELLICLPPDWKLQQKDFEDESNFWPVRWLKILARFPHEYQTWLWQGHTIPNGDPPVPFADNTELCCMLLEPPVLFGPGLQTLEVNADKTIHFFALLPLYREEMELKLQEGSAPLLELFDERGINELLDPRRRNVCA